MRRISTILTSAGANCNLSRRDRICANIIDYGLLGLLVFAPLPAASVYEWSVLVIQLAVLIMMAAYILMREKPRANEFLSQALKWPRILFLGFFAFVFVQVIPLPKFLVGLFSPAAQDFQRLYAFDFPKIKFLSFSIIPSYTFQRALELVAYFFLGFLVIRTVTRRYQIQRLFAVIIAMGVFEAFYGLFELYSKSPRILFYRKVYNLDSVTGTFVNRNHFSGYLEMIIPLAIGLMVARISLFSSESPGWRGKLLRLSEKGLSTNILISAGIVLMAVGIVFSKSRSGVFVLIFAFILFFGLGGLYSNMPRFRKKWIRTFLSVALIGIISVSLYVGVNATLERFSLDRLLHEGRPAYWANALRTFSSYPLLGTGLGTYGAMAPNLDSESGPVAIVHAHNDHLEYLSELGIIGFSLLLGGILFGLIVSFAVWGMRRNPEVKGLALGGIISIVCIMVHGLTDFNLHIPANMVLFSVALPLTLVTTFYRMKATPGAHK
jgi:O-antigen ligase